MRIGCSCGSQGEPGTYYRSADRAIYGLNSCACPRASSLSSVHKLQSPRDFDSHAGGYFDTMDAITIVISQ